MPRRAVTGALLTVVPSDAGAIAIGAWAGWPTRAEATRRSEPDESPGKGFRSAGSFPARIGKHSFERCYWHAKPRPDSDHGQIAAFGGLIGSVAPKIKIPSSCHRH